MSGVPPTFDRPQPAGAPRPGRPDAAPLQPTVTQQFVRHLVMLATNLGYDKVIHGYTRDNWDQLVRQLADLTTVASVPEVVVFPPTVEPGSRPVFRELDADETDSGQAELHTFQQMAEQYAIGFYGVRASLHANTAFVAMSSCTPHEVNVFYHDLDDAGGPPRWLDLPANLGWKIEEADDISSQLVRDRGITSIVSVTLNLSYLQRVVRPRTVAKTARFVVNKERIDIQADGE